VWAASGSKQDLHSAVRKSCGENLPHAVAVAEQRVGGGPCVHAPSAPAPSATSALSPPWLSAGSFGSFKMMAVSPVSSKTRGSVGHTAATSPARSTPGNRACGGESARQSQRTRSFWVGREVREGSYRGARGCMHPPSARRNAAGTPRLSNTEVASGSSTAFSYASAPTSNLHMPHHRECGSVINDCPAWGCSACT
jgi:hypothetical protein